MEKPLFEKSKKAYAKPYKNKGQMEEIWSKNGKWPPKSLKKHCLHKVFASRFRKAKIPYKTNGKSIILELKTENGVQNHQKSIRFFTINHMAVRHVAKPYKTNGN